jgi:hypothetical protein
MKNINEFFIKAGGDIKVAVALGLHHLTVQRWRKHGIPLKYWEKLSRLYDITPAEIYTVNQKILKSKF